MAKLFSRVFRPRIKAEVPHQVRREVTLKAVSGQSVALPVVETKERSGHDCAPSSDKAMRGAQLRGEILAWPVDEACAGLADDEGGDGPDLKRAGVLTILLDRA